jgi:hypothetical protein
VTALAQIDPITDRTGNLSFTIGFKGGIGPAGGNSRTNSMSSVIIHPYMDASPESEQSIFNNFWALFDGNSPFGHPKILQKISCTGGNV